MLIGNTGKMNNYCRECLRHLKEDEKKEGICKLCKENNGYGNRKYNYLTDHNSKDPWDDQAPYSESYTDQYDW